MKSRRRLVALVLTVFTTLGLGIAAATPAAATDGTIIVET